MRKSFEKWWNRILPRPMWPRHTYKDYRYYAGVIAYMAYRKGRRDGRASVSKTIVDLRDISAGRF